MSLLMKALEKAAKDRDEARAEPTSEAPATEPAWVTASQSPQGPAEPATLPPTEPGARSELSLEPIAIPTEPSAPPPPRPEAHPAAPTRARAATAAREQQQARAATVMRAAGSAASAGPVAYLMARPVWIVGLVALLIGIGYGIYVYLQIFHPALFLPKPPIAPKAPATSVSPIGQAPAPNPAPVPMAGTGTVTGTTTVLPPVAPATPGVAAPGASTTGAPTTGTSTTGASAPEAPTTTPPTQAAAPDSSPPASAPAPRRAAEKPAPEAAPALPARPPAPRDAIVVTRGTAAPAVSPMLNDAYAALRADRRDDAQRGYERMLRTDPRNIDVLLGLASIATTEGKTEEASSRYMQILELDPRNALAQAGMISLVGRADPLAAESRLRQLIAREPSAYLHFTLGNLYADQRQWAPAQQAYFQAYSLEPGNPDYAFNLAVALEHISQSKLALGFYRRAVELAGATGTARFEVAQAQQRISRLASQVE